MKSDVYIIVIFYNPSDEQVCKTLEIANYHNVIVVDNSANECVFPSITENKSSIVYKPLGQNRGIACAQNIGIRIVLKLGGKFILFLDQDSEISNTFLDDLFFDFINAKEHHPNLVALGPVVCDKDTYASYKMYKGEIQNNMIVTPTLISSGTLVEVASFDKIGLMEEDLFIDYVDHEWCWRAASKGYICCMDLNVNMVHKVGNKTIFFGRLPFLISSPSRYFYQYRNSLWLIRRNYVPLNWKIKTLVRNIVGFFLIPCFSSAPCDVIKSMIKGLLEGFKSS